MAVKFGSDGTLYCNTVRYNYKQARNMIADNSYGNISTSSVWNNVAVVTNKGYKTYRSFNCSASGQGNIFQYLPALYSSHVYYFSCYYNTTLSKSQMDIGINGFTTLSLNSTSGSWVKSSVRAQATRNYNDGTQRVFINVYSGSSGSLYVCKLILIDLTDTFGSGNEPSKEWCDNNIREHEVIVNYGNISNNVTNANIATRYTVGSMDKHDYGYLQLDSNWEPREYMWGLVPYSSVSEAYVYSASSFTLNTSYKYYFHIEIHGYMSNGSYDFYFPIAEPLLGQVPMVINEDFNGGGGMSGWKRISMFGDRSSFTAGSYQLRFDINNRNTSSWQRVTGLVLVYVQSLVTQYNKYNGTSITINDVNKEWCDRWIDGRSSPIIHIKDPNNTRIKFNTSYDVVCNDIEIRPEMNKITFDKTGTIKCKKLVRTQAY